MKEFCPVMTMKQFAWTVKVWRRDCLTIRKNPEKCWLNVL
jgi:hypothetical protein